MNAPVQIAMTPAQRVYRLIVAAKPANLATRKDLIRRNLCDDAGTVCEAAKEIMHCLYSPLRVFNVKPKKGWVVGTDEPTQSWDEAFELLLKLESREITGNAAKQAAEDMAASLPTWAADLFLRCLNKRPDAGMGATIINKELKHYIPKFDCSLAEPVDFARCEWPMIIQPKLDGVRTLAHVELATNKVTYYSRAGLLFTSNGHLDESILAFAKTLCHDLLEHSGIFLDGEVFGKDFKETISAARKKDAATSNTDFHIYDYIPAKAFFDGDFPVNQAIRTRTLLHTHTAHIKQHPDSRIKLVPTVVVYDENSAKNEFASYQEEGFEGAVLKNPKASYSFRRSYNWMKMKSEESADLKIVGYEEGTGKYEGQMGALIVDFNGVEVNVGSGLTDALRRSMWEDKETSLIGRLVEVEYMEVTPDGSLRHPRFVCFRDLPESPGIKI